MNAIDHASHLACVDEQRLSTTIAKAMIAFVASDEPEAERNLSVVEKLARQRDHAIDKIRFDDVFSNLSFARLIRRHAAVGEHESGQTRRREVMDEVLHPRKVRIARWRHTIFPAHVFPQTLTTPVAVIERRVGEDV